MKINKDKINIDLYLNLVGKSTDELFNFLSKNKLKENVEYRFFTTKSKLFLSTISSNNNRINFEFNKNKLVSVTVD